jgi:hypothetical protein
LNAAVPVTVHGVRFSAKNATCATSPSFTFTLRVRGRKLQPRPLPMLASNWTVTMRSTVARGATVA